MKINAVVEQEQIQTIVIYPGRFQPPHIGHAKTYQSLAKKYGAANTFVATSNKTDGDKSPFEFDEKKQLLIAAGVPADSIVQVVNTYAAKEITDRYDPTKTRVFYAVGAKDMAEDPRFASFVKKDGSAAYLQPLEGSDQIETADKHAYIIVAPTVEFTVNGKPFTSASEFRQAFKNANPAEQAELAQQLYGAGAQKVMPILQSKLFKTEEDAIRESIEQLWRKATEGRKHSLAERREAAINEIEMIGIHPDAFPKQHVQDLLSRATPMPQLQLEEFKTHSVTSGNVIALIIAESDQQIAGFAGFYKNEKSNIWQVGNAVVYPPYQGQALIAKLYKSIKEQLKKSIQSDVQHSEQAKKLWTKTLPGLGVKVMIHDSKTGHVIDPASTDVNVYNSADAYRYTWIIERNDRYPIRDQLHPDNILMPYRGIWLESRANSGDLLKLAKNQALNAPTPTVKALAEKYRVTVPAINHRLGKGIKVEMEHTTDVEVAREIALDHLGERLDYYEQLAKLEKSNDQVIEYSVFDLHYEFFEQVNQLDIKLFESKDEYVRLKKFLEDYKSDVPSTGNSYLYVSVSSTPAGKILNVASFDQPHKLVGVENNRYVFEVNGQKKSYPESGGVFGDHVQDVMLFSTPEKYQELITMLLLNFNNSAGWKISTKRISVNEAKRKRKTKGKKSIRYGYFPWFFGSGTGTTGTEGDAGGGESLNELANAPYRYMLTKKIAAAASGPYRGENHYLFRTDHGQEFIVTIVLKSFVEGEAHAEVAFADKSDWSTDITGKGDAFRVFATVAQILNDYIKTAKLPITQLYFTGKTQDPSRIKLYDTIARRLGNHIPGFTLAKTGSDGVEKGYLFKKTNTSAQEKSVDEVIKLGGSKPSSNVKGFMDEFMSSTETHPFDHSARIYGGTTISLSEFNNGIHISDINTWADKQQGHGTAAVIFLQSLADKYNVALTGVAKAYSTNKDHIRSSQLLKKWYEKQGFAVGKGDKSSGYPIKYTPSKLEEVNMSPGALADFAKTNMAKAMTVGFEAEMVIKNLKNDDEDDYEEDDEPDWDADRAVDLDSRKAMRDSVRVFFLGNPPGPGQIGVNLWDDIDNVLNDIDQDYNEWHKKQFKIWAQSEEGRAKIRKKVDKTFGRDDPDFNKDKAADAVNDQKGEYWKAIKPALWDKYREKNYRSDSQFREFMLEKQLDTMRKISSIYTYDLRWPYFLDRSSSKTTYEDIEASFKKATGYTTTVSSGYHSATRKPGLWIFEPDSSIEPSGVELVSPPMPFEQSMEALDKFFAWATDFGAEANKSTGFHVGVSIPDQTWDNVDHLKLILFLGDQYVLSQFGRSANSYANSSLGRIKKIIGRSDSNSMLDQFKKGLESEAAKAVRSMMVPTNERYVSVNIKRNYIEFRSAGGNYFKKIPEIKNTMLRYVRAMAIAADPAAEKQEYAKKLYKLLAVQLPQGGEIVNIFAQYAAGSLTQTELKGLLKASAAKRSQKKLPQGQGGSALQTSPGDAERQRQQAAASDGNATVSGTAATGQSQHEAWEIFRFNNPSQVIHRFTAASPTRALRYANNWAAEHGLGSDDWDMARSGHVNERINNTVRKYTPDNLEEVSMSPGALADFAKTDMAKNMNIGFEAEMVIPGLGDQAAYEEDPEPDWDADEEIEWGGDWRNQIRDFFRNRDAGAVSTGSATLNRIFDSLNERINEWIDQSVSEWLLSSEARGEFRRRFKDRFDLDFTDTEMKDIINDAEDGEYWSRFDEIREDARIDWTDDNYEVLQKDYLADSGMDSMKDFYDEFNREYEIYWPYLIPYNDEDDISYEDIESSFVTATGYNVTVSKEYHSAARKPGLWIIEPDSSIEPSGVELVSPPMPLDQGLEALDKFFAWATSYGAKANQSTGFHMGVSIPDQTMDNVDHLKLILFLGDQYVLSQFGRSANSYAKSSYEKMQKSLASGVASGYVNVVKILDNFKKDLNGEAAKVTRQQMVSTNDRYVSVNIKRNYIEFRSAGGNYFQKIPEIKNSMLRYVRALAIAADPAAEKQEYAKKLYKLIASTMPSTDETLISFIRYSAGTITQSELKAELQKTAVRRREKKLPPAAPAQSQETAYEIFRYATPSQALHRYTALSPRDAEHYAISWAARNGLGSDGWSYRRAGQQLTNSYIIRYMETGGSHEFWERVQAHSNSEAIAIFRSRFPRYTLISAQLEITPENAERQRQQAIAAAAQQPQAPAVAGYHLWRVTWSSSRQPDREEVLSVRAQDHAQAVQLASQHIRTVIPPLASFRITSVVRT